MTQQTVTNGSATRKEPTAECHLIYQEVKILTYGQYPNITPKSEVNISLGEFNMPSKANQ